MTNKTKRILIFIICFLCFLWGFFAIQDLFKADDKNTFQGISGFYSEPKDSLDAVMIGASTVHAFWQPALAWADHGIAVYSLSVDSMRVQSYLYMLTEAHRRQPHALYIVNLNSIKSTKITDVDIHRTTNLIPFSYNKLKMINNLANEAGYKWLEQLQFYFPIIRFHSDWPNLTTWEFSKSVDGLKHSYKNNTFLSKVEDQTEKFYISDEEAEIPPETRQIIENLLDYCDEHQMNVLFISVPQALGRNSQFFRILTSVKKVIQERGYPYLDLQHAVDEMGIQPKTDFYNGGHTNVHGSIKFTEYLAQYLVDHYGFRDKRGMPGWESWDKAAELYANIINPYCLPFEREHAVRNYDLEAPVLNEAVVDGQTITLSWNAADGAHAYDIYRKSNISGDKDWAYLDSVDAETLQITDSGLKAAKNYTYTVVPKEIRDGIEYYGNFDFTGVTGTTAK